MATNNSLSPLQSWRIALLGFNPAAVSCGQHRRSFRCWDWSAHTGAACICSRCLHIHIWCVSVCVCLPKCVLSSNCHKKMRNSRCCAHWALNLHLLTIWPLGDVFADSCLFSHPTVTEQHLESCLHPPDAQWEWSKAVKFWAVKPKQWTASTQSVVRNCAFKLCLFLLF